MMNGKRIDLHMHSTVSDGTDSPEELLGKAREAGLDLFALTDHDAVKGYGRIRNLLGPGDPRVLSGVEFSCQDGLGKYHILGYNYDPESEAIRQVVETGHQLRIAKLTVRLEYLKTNFGFTFPEEEVQRLYALDNPGKPHIGNLMVRCGYAESKEEAINGFLNRVSPAEEYVHPEQAIRGILKAGGIPVLAHPAYGSGDEVILDGELDGRVRRLMDFGLRGLEVFYSGFSSRILGEAAALAEKYGLLVTAGSDYHGKNKLVALGDTKLDPAGEMPEGLRRFLEETGVWQEWEG